jgi:hypothetical protein
MDDAVMDDPLSAIDVDAPANLVGTEARSSSERTAASPSLSA